MNKKTLTILVVVITTVMAGAVVAMGVLMGNSLNSMSNYKLQLESVYKRAFYELVDDVNNLETNLGKLTITTSVTLQENCLSKICTLSNEAQNHLAVLPLDHEIINTTVQFVNRLGGFCFSLQQSVVGGKTISDDNMDKIEELHQSSQEVKYELNRLSVMIASGYMIVDHVQNPEAGSDSLSGQLGSITDNSVEYPELIYDGPFSESVLNKEFKGFPDNEVSKEEAEAIVKEWFSDYSIIDCCESSGSCETFIFEIRKGSGVNAETLYVQVTKKGGCLLTISSQKVSNNFNKTEEECIAVAEDFVANTIGISGLKSVWSTTCNGFLYANLCYMLGDVVVYPDMIKVKVSRETGEVCGYEAKSYYMNHVSRSEPTPTYDPAAAKSKVDGKLNVLTEKLVIIPGDYVGEVFCYEFKCIYAGSMYYVYIDAVTGMEVSVLKVIETDDGELFI